VQCTGGVPWVRTFGNWTGLDWLGDKTGWGLFFFSFHHVLESAIKYEYDFRDFTIGFLSET